MKKLFKKTGDKKKWKTNGEKWYARIKDFRNDRTHRIALFVDEKVSELFVRRVETLIAYKIAGEMPDPFLSRWISTLPPSFTRKLERVGLVDGTRNGNSMLLEQHLLDFNKSLLAKGRTLDHATLLTKRIKHVLKGCNFAFPSDMKADKVQKFLAKMHNDEDISLQTINHYIQAMRQFAKWMQVNERIPQLLLLQLEKFNAGTDRRRVRRALALKEIEKLLETTKNGPQRWKMTGPERALLYKIALQTGLRASEIKSLRKESFNFVDKIPTVTVEAINSKNRKKAVLPLRPRTAEEIKKYLESQEPGCLLFPGMPSSAHTAKMVRKDQEDAGIPYVDDHGEVADFHALRGSYTTALEKNGVGIKELQMLARHSDVNLTLNSYVHSSLEDQAKALEKLPELPNVLD